MAESDKLNFKIPRQCENSQACSAFVIKAIDSIMERAIQTGRNKKIFIHANLKYGLPMENINKIAGPFVEAWAFEVFQAALEDETN